VTYCRNLKDGFDVIAFLGDLLCPIQEPNDASGETLFQSCEPYQQRKAVGAAEAKQGCTPTRQTMAQLGQLATRLDGCFFMSSQVLNYVLHPRAVQQCSKGQ
jgi:hypothetical protein